MDITTLDRATGRLVIQIRLDEITQGLESGQLDGNGAANYHAIRDMLQHQLVVNDGEYGDDEDISNDDAGGTPLGSSTDTDNSNSYRDEDATTAETRQNSGDNVKSASEPEDELVPEPKPEPELSADCCACGDSKSEKDTIKLECSHIYCGNCVIELFRFAVHKDASLFPPRCCKTTISLDTNTNGLKGCRTLLSAELLSEVNAKQMEQDKAQETLCSGTGCDHVVPKGNISGGIATCDLCSIETCTTCKGRAHEGLCSEDGNTIVLMATAGKVKWQQCSNCKNMVELNTGCFHIICRCGHQFCYMCGATWKTCSCPQFDENHLLRPTPTDTLEMAPIACQHIWEQHEGVACARCDRTDLSSVMQCSRCHIEQCTRCLNNRD